MSESSVFIDQSALNAVVQGLVQGVSFRAFVKSISRQLDLVGFVRNLSSGDVEVVAEGKKESLEKLIVYLNKGPASARVEKTVIKWTKASNLFKEFTIEY
jgi:acylphosphatase